MKDKQPILINVCVVLLLFLSTFTLNAQQLPQQERLNRGVVAVKTSSGVFVSWRFLGTDAKKTSFDLYRDGNKVNTAPIATVTNYQDAGGSLTSKYVLKTIVDDAVVETSEEVAVWENQYIRLPLNRPESGVTLPYTVTNNKEVESYPNGQAYSYSPNDCSVGDVDGDGEYEIILKWDPSNSRDNSLRGYTGNVYLDCYKLNGTFMWRIDLGRNIRAGAHYTQFMVYDLDGDGKAEVVCRTAPGTIDGTGKAVLLGDDKVSDDYRTSEGLILKGSEYLTVFNGQTGGEIHTVEYNPPRSGYSWGDSYGNRENRFLACIAYLDGVKPSVVMCRGYYTRAVLVAYDFDGTTLKQRWIHDDSKTAGQGAYGEGCHSLSVGDIDNDGFDEIVYGACAIDHDGKLVYRKGFGHGDALHLSDLDPNLDGLEVFMPHEEKGSPYGFHLRSAGTGEVIYGEWTGTDVGRGLAADIDAKHRGSEFWSTANGNIYNCKGQIIATSGRPSVNFRLYWDGDLQDELLDGATISKWNGSKTNTLLNLGNYHKASSCNSTKKTPNLSADLFGDWREEVVLWDGNTSAHLLIFTTTIPTEYRVPTLMHDHVYRMSVAWQNVAYNQPPHLGYFLGDFDVESVSFTRKGEGELSQTIEMGKSIVPISYEWKNATDVECTGLPDGVEIEKDLNNQLFTISGTPAKVGTYTYTIRSLGGLNEATLTGTIRVKEETTLTTVAYFSFDEASGLYAANQTYGQAEAIDFTPEWVEGVKGNAIKFPASPVARRMVQHHYPQFDFAAEDFTLELWFRSAGGSGVDWYLLHTGSHAKNADTGATGKWIGVQYKNNNLTFGIDDDAVKSNVDVPAEAYFNNQWTHVVCVRDTDNKKIKLYLNGELAGEKTDGTGNISQTEDLVLANCNVNFNTPFTGSMDELSFFKGAMNAEIVRERYEANRPSSIGGETIRFAQVYPIRIVDQVQVRFECQTACKASIAIYTMSGEVIYREIYHIDGSEQLTVSGLDSLPAGVYSIVIETPEGRLVKKLIK